jgi:hypothetical protein
MKHPLRSFFIVSSGFVLLLTALAKLVGLSQGARILYQDNALLGIQNQFVYGAAAMAELAIATFLVLGKSYVEKAAYLLWLTACFGAYRLANSWLSIPEPCSCLGKIADWIPGITTHVDTIALGILVYFAAGSIVILFHHSSNSGAKGFKASLRAGDPALLLIPIILGQSYLGEAAERTPEPHPRFAVEATNFANFIPSLPAIDTLVVKRTLHFRPVFFNSLAEGKEYIRNLEANKASAKPEDSQSTDLTALRHLPNRHFVYQEVSTPEEIWSPEVRSPALLGRNAEGWWNFHPQGLQSTDAPDGIFLEHTGKKQTWHPLMYQRATEPLRLGFYDVDLSTLKPSITPLPQDGTTQFMARSLPEYGDKPIEGTVTTRDGFVTQIEYSLLRAPAQKVQGRSIEITHRDGQLALVAIANQFKGSSSFTPYADYQFISWKAAPRQLPKGYCSPEQFMKETDTWFLTKANGEIYNMKFDPNTPTTIHNSTMDPGLNRKYLIYGIWIFLTLLLFFGIHSARKRRTQQLSQQTQ